MKFKHHLLATLLMTLATMSSAQEISQLACEDFKPSPEALTRFPDLKGACEAIIERNGELYAKFTAIVRRASNRSVTLHLPATDHTFRITPDASARVSIGGRQTRVRDLTRGQEIHIYLATSEFGKPDIEEVVLFSDTNVLIAVQMEPVPMLPRTASLLPTLGLAGLALLLFAALMRRQRLSHYRQTLSGLFLATVCLVAPTPDAMADSHVAVKPGRLITSMIRTAAIVEAVDHETRKLKLIDASGRRFTTSVGEEVTNFDEIEPRDRIVMEYMDSIAIVVMPAGAPEADQGMMAEAAGEGQKPALRVAESYMVKATVLELNLTERRATLHYEDGSVDSIKVADDVPLELVEVGDEVRFRVTHAIAVSVRKVGDM
jgi:hypothetical protein